MWRTILMLVVPALLSLGILAACDDFDEQRGTTDEGEATEEPDDQGAARTDPEEDQPQSQTAGEAEGEEGPDRASDSLDVTLVDYEIQGIETVEAGIITFSFTNEGEHEHGLAVEPADGGEVVGMLTAPTGETDELELELEAGDYNVYCPVGDHRDAEGMETSLTVE